MRQGFRDGWRRIAAALTGIVVIFGAVASAQEPGALILDVTGETDPAVEAFEELPVGARVRLGDGVSMSLSHYGSCEDVTVEGGAVMIGKSNIGLARARILDRTKAACSQALDLAEGDVAAGGVVLRGMAHPAAIPVRPVFIVTGDLAGYDRLVIMQRATVVVSIPLRGRRADWPAGSASLEANRDYTVSLQSKTASKVFSVAVKATPDADGRVILRP